ncbi:hypothetical protein [Streptomyces sp. H39-S7]|uniref:hypothetical protein n=1 Tax=Streptomyces sp. H39-S7 TaxID=3004357 RepID=UPI0022AEDC61|nr:hypothetical protein [Streptomyces sp. H39-S7]MCZ4122798.1 hypothetical protein [Streptomyces sp. H39-S7]
MLRPSAPPAPAAPAAWQARVRVLSRPPTTWREQMAFRVGHGDRLAPSHPLTEGGQDTYYAGHTERPTTPSSSTTEQGRQP